MHETLHQGHRPAFALQRLSDVVNLESNFLSDDILEQGFGMVSAAGHGDDRHPFALALVQTSSQTATQSADNRVIAHPVEPDRPELNQQQQSQGFRPVESHWRVMFAVESHIFRLQLVHRR